ncbi:fasciclin domain-containing protein [Alteriqipengyuania lutimaris]|nr:fasciclin domain-containing protein [Alteriqipengyuania lutimaris]MBB3035295.1 putative surface protein with fasciclin (FAS1) repeats [Alteriqipengyuania lutimaris]
MRSTIVPLLGALSLMLAGCGDPDEAGETAQAAARAGDSTLGAMIGTIDELSIASEVIGNAELEDPFEGAGAYTIFLPRNEAFEELPEGELELLRSEEGRDGVIAILTTHIAVGAIAREDLETALEVNGGSLELEGVAEQPILLRKVGGEILVGAGDDAPHLTNISKAASNGVVYVIDGFIPSQD